MSYYFPTKQELTEYFNGKTEKVFVHYFNIATYFLKKDELLSLPPEQRQDYFSLKIKKLPVSAQTFYYEKLSELVEANFLNQDGFGFKLATDDEINNELYYLRDILASGNKDIIALARQYCDRQTLQLAASYLTKAEKQKVLSIINQLNKEK